MSPQEAGSRPEQGSMTREELRLKRRGLSRVWFPGPRWNPGCDMALRGLHLLPGFEGPLSTGGSGRGIGPTGQGFYT